jgi:microcystin-dependent protein
MSAYEPPIEMPMIFDADEFSQTTTNSSTSSGSGNNNNNNNSSSLLTSNNNWSGSNQFARIPTTTATNTASNTNEFATVAYISSVANNVIGEVKMIASTSLPSKSWLWCDGGLYSTSDYPDLYKVIGQTYGPYMYNPTTNGIVSTTTNVSNTINISQRNVTSSNYVTAGTVTVKNNTLGGSITVSIPVQLNTALTTQTAYAGSAALNLYNNITNNVTLNIYKNNTLFQTVVPSIVAGGVQNTKSFSGVTFGPTTSTLTENTSSFMCTYQAIFFPSLNNDQIDTYDYGLSIELNSFLTTTTPGNFYNLSIYNEIVVNPTTFQPPVFSNYNINDWKLGGPPQRISSAPLQSGFIAASLIFTSPALTPAYFYVPNLCKKAPLGADATSALTTTFEGSSVYTGGSRVLKTNQLPSHSHTLGSGVLSSSGGNN